VPIHFAVDIKHLHLAEEFWELFLRSLIVLLNQTFPNHFFDLFLRLRVIWISILQFDKLLLLFPFLLHLVLDSLADDLLQLVAIALLRLENGLCQLGVLALKLR
jgi:hypothetical protein